MRITVFNGSPRGQEGNTHRIVTEVLAGAAEAGAETRNYFLVDHDIRPCKGCFACWGETPGACAIQDDMAGLLEAVRAADLVVFATPLYVDNVTGIMKLFMDRLIPLVDPHFTQDAHGECQHPQRYAGPVPRMAVIANCGFPETSQFQVLRLLFRRIARNMNSELVAEIYRSAGELMRSNNLLVRPFLSRYRRLLREAGRELVEKGRLSEQTTAALEKPIVPPSQYIKGANRYWEKRLALRANDE